MEKLTSKYVRAWCEEWALAPAATEQALTTYAQVENEAEVLACLAGLASAQRSWLIRTGRLTTPEAVIANPSLRPTDPDPDWNSDTDSVSKRLFRG